jgi:hypothetical protein
MRPAQLPGLRFSRGHQSKLQSMPKMIRHDEAAFEISYVGKWLEWNQTSECNWFVVKISEPPISVSEMTLLQLRPCWHEFIKGVDCLCKGDAINLVDLVGHLTSGDLDDFDGQQFPSTIAMAVLRQTANLTPCGEQSWFESCPSYPSMTNFL